VTVAVGDGAPDGGAPLAGRAGEVLVVPAAAVVDVRGASFAFVAARGGGFEARPVDVGVHVGDDLVVLAGLDEGEQVVVLGAVLLKGELIRGELGGEP
jgi:cobalt-zinc-cadmium efflux system membrane fusion protein